MSDPFVTVPTTLADVLAVLAPGWPVAGARDIIVDTVCIDSRLALPGSLFIALPGDHVDGHDFVPAALSAGARVAIVERPVAGVPCVDVVNRTAPDPCRGPVSVRVPSALAALQLLASDRRRQHMDLRVIGITGSVGKTTAKEAVASVLGARYSVLKSRGNRNNEIGLPLTLLTARQEHTYAVLEMGMYALGEIAELCRIAGPQAGLVTNVEPVHLERLGTIEHIAEAKAELVRAVSGDGWVALNADDARVVAMGSLTQARTVFFGLGANADVRATDVDDQGLDGSTFTVTLGSSVVNAPISAEQRLRTRMLGPTAVRAALAGVTVGLLEGLTWDEIQDGLDDLGQGLRLTSRRGRDNITILDDCYNASPSSVIAALEFLASLASRRIGVLGDMLELGALEDKGHRQVGVMAATTCDLLVTVGERSQAIAAAARYAGLHPSSIASFLDNAGAIAYLEDQLHPGDAVLVKGSRSMRMEEIVAALLEETP